MPIFAAENAPALIRGARKYHPSQLRTMNIQLRTLDERNSRPPLADESCKGKIMDASINWWPITANQTFRKQDADNK